MEAERTVRSILVINNAPFGRGTGVDTAVEPATGAFLEELAGLVPELAVAQGVVDFKGVATQNTFELAGRDNIRVDAIPWRIDGRIWRALSYLRALPWMLGLVRRSDQLHIFLPGHLPILFCAAARLMRRPYGVYLRGEVGEPWLRHAISGARFVIAANEEMRRAASRYSSKVILVAPMVELNGGEIASERTPRTQPPWRILFVGRIEPAKGISELLEAVLRVQKGGLRVELDLAGWAPEFEEYRRSAKKLGVADVRFHGAIADRARLQELYDRADLFVLPTHSEGFPRVLYEAMYSRLPILTTFVGGIPAIMEDERNCLRIPARDTAGLAAVLERALRDERIRSQIASGGAETIRQVLDTELPTHAAQVAAELTAAS